MFEAWRRPIRVAHYNSPDYVMVAEISFLFGLGIEGRESLCHMRPHVRRTETRKDHARMKRAQPCKNSRWPRKEGNSPVGCRPLANFGLSALYRDRVSVVTSLGHSEPLQSMCRGHSCRRKLIGALELFHRFNGSFVVLTRRGPVEVVHLYQCPLNLGHPFSRYPC